MSILTVERAVLQKNDEIAADNRTLFERFGLMVLNIVSSPGSGKTSLLERVLGNLRGRIPAGVIEGDVQTDLDARRVAEYGVPVVQIVTHGGCHLDAGLVRDAAAALPLHRLQLLLIENVGNLVCPANYDLGESMKVVVVSITEGDDKPLKYPAMFRKASLLVVNKMDLAPHVTADPGILVRNALSINPNLKIFRTSCISGEGIHDLCAWIEEEVAVW
ncbi:MAG: hydrogenase nickel incorporation protein HypB [Ignavibacterium sp.]|jgi:hydrogenase nickel incorporation protein HypB